ncbi:hypothetical protein Tco_1472313 [Tanacetum coccineum]
MTGKGKVTKVRNVKSSFQLVDEPDEEPAQPEPEPEPEQEGEDYDMEQGHAHVGGVAIPEHVAEAIRPLPVVKGKGKAIVTEEQDTQSMLALHTPKRRSTTDQFIFQRRTPATKEASTGPSAQPQDGTSANIIRDSPSSANAEIGARSDKENSRGDTEIFQITKDLGEDVDKLENIEEKTMELDQDQAGSDPGETHVSQPPPEQVLMDEDQAGPDLGISLHPLSTPVIDLSPPIPASSTTQAPIFTATTTTTTTTLPPPPQQQSTTKSELAECVTALEKKLSDLEQKNKNLDNTTRNLGSMVFTLELRDLPYKINETVRENVKEAV